MTGCISVLRVCRWNHSDACSFHEPLNFIFANFAVEVGKPYVCTSDSQVNVPLVLFDESADHGRFDFRVVMDGRSQSDSVRHFSDSDSWLVVAQFFDTGLHGRMRLGGFDAFS